MTKSVLLFLLCLPTSLSLLLPSSDRLIVSPSIAKANLLNLQQDLTEAIEGGAEWLHVSIQDGTFVPKISFGANIVTACRKVFPNTILDVKLSIANTERKIADFCDADI